MILINQYNEILNFIVASEGGPSSGVGSQRNEADKVAVALSYIQVVTQIVSEDDYLVSASGNQTSILANSEISEMFDN